MATTVATIDTQHGDMVHDAQFDYYGRRLATCSSDRIIKVYDVSGDETVASAELSGSVIGTRWMDVSTCLPGLPSERDTQSLMSYTGYVGHAGTKARFGK